MGKKYSNHGQRINKAQVKSLLALRERSQVELAAYLGITPIYLNEILCHTKHGSGHYPKIAAFLSVPLRKILKTSPAPSKGAG